MGSRRRDDEGGQLILLAGILLILAWLLFATETALVANIGQESGREASNPVQSDWNIVRKTLERALPAELKDANGIVQCPPVGDPSGYVGRVRGVLALLVQLEANRGQSLIANVLPVADPVDVAEPVPDPYASLNSHRLTTSIQLRLSGPGSTIYEQIDYKFRCER